MQRRDSPAAAPHSDGTGLLRLDGGIGIGGADHLAQGAARRSECVPNGAGSFVDASGISPDQQFQAGPSCNGVFATPTTPTSPNDLCPANEYKSKYLKIPAAGTENDNHNPPRIAPRNLFDLSVGQDNLSKGDKHKWSLRLSAINLANKEALYNFISTFSGTHM